MTRTLINTDFARPRTGFFASLLGRISHARKIGSDTRRLDTMPRERLKDMSIAPRTEANYRTSGEAGPIPQTTLW